FLEQYSGSFLGHFEVVLGTRGGLEAICDFLLSLFQRFYDGRPDVLLAEPYEKEECEDLTQNGCIQIHGFTHLWVAVSAWRTATSEQLFPSADSCGHRTCKHLRIVYTAKG